MKAWSSEAQSHGLPLAVEGRLTQIILSGLLRMLSFLSILFFSLQIVKGGRAAGDTIACHLANT